MGISVDGGIDIITRVQVFTISFRWISGAGTKVSLNIVGGMLKVY